jgi:PAS domain S-box-containing protein
MKILIVDDNPDDRKVLRYIIKAHGHEVIEAGNGQEGLEMAADSKPDLIISDALMPVMDGFQFLRNIKQDADLNLIPFIFYSAVYDGHQDKQLAFSFGADAYIVKPMEPEYLWKQVEKIIERIGEDKVKNTVVSPIEKDLEYLKRYGQIVATKLEEKVVELEYSLAERKRAEAQILKQNRVYAVLSNINQTIIRVNKTTELLDEACRIVIHFGKFRMAWIGMVNDQTNIVDVVASYGVIGDYLEKINIDLNDEKQSNGPVGKAVKTGKYQISNNILNDECMIPWRDNAKKYGYKSIASFPIIIFEKVIGAFTIYSHDMDFFVEDDIVLLDEMTKNISFALEYIEKETRRRQAEGELKFQNILLQTEHDSSDDGIYIVDEQRKIINFNRRFVEIWGMSQQVLDTCSSELVLHESLDKLVDPEEFVNRVEYLYCHRDEKSSEEILFKDGRVIDRYSAPMIGSDGAYFGRFWNFRDITEKKISTKKLQKSVEEKDILLRELYHRTKNNMQVICSMLVLKSSQADDIAVKGICDEIVAKIQTMALVHQKLYESNDLSIISLPEYVKSITDIIINNNDLTGREILIHQSVDDLPISIDTAMPLGLLLNELLINSIKHAFPDNRDGAIWVELLGNADDINIKYRDNGIGLPEDFDSDSTHTFGMRIVQDITRMQLGGEIKIFNDKGFNCHINIKTDLYRKRV